ncbi:MAG TPA: tetratricopeptide repeat protein [Saprospiraceae bacterium]|nr:tetratricopeptide repeat protein [Saprospiraceae bacterium]HMQ82757.1 tetratricopeptide repeat protein [Saprospiraceae bacterium]
MIRFAFLWSFICWSWVAVFAQTNSKLDSLLSLSRSAASDTQKVLALLDAGKLFQTRQPDSALLFFNQGLQMAQSIGYERGEARILINKGNSHFDKAEYQLAIENQQAALPICEKLGMKLEMVAAYNNMGNAYQQLGMKRLAVDCFEKSIRAMQGLDLPPHFPIVVQGNLLSLYIELNLNDKVLELGPSVLQSARDIGDEESVAIVLQHLGNAHIGKEQPDSALPYLEQAVALARKLDYPQLLATGLGITADIYRQDGRNEQAMRLYEEALAIAQKSGDPLSTKYNLHGISLLFFDEKKFDQAREYANRALALVETEEDAYVHALYLTLSDIALAQDSLELFWSYREKYRINRARAARANEIEALQEFETKYETEKKEQQIRQLEQAQTISKLRLRQKNNLTLGLALLSILLLVTAFLIWRNLQNRKRLADQQFKIQQQLIRELEQEKQLHAANAVLRAQEDERSRIARDLHDGLGGMLSGIKQNLFGMTGNQVLSEAASQAFQRTISDLDRSIGELRNIARNMMPEALLRFGLKDALQDYCDQLQRPGQLDIHFQAFGLESRLDQDTEIVLFRIIQELVNNALKHAEAKNIIVQVIRDENRLHLTVEDDGKGFDVQALDRFAGVGWLNIQSRSAYLGASPEIRSAPGQGTSISIEVDLNRSAFV